MASLTNEPLTFGILRDAPIENPHQGRAIWFHNRR